MVFWSEMGMVVSTFGPLVWRVTLTFDQDAGSIAGFADCRVKSDAHVGHRRRTSDPDREMLNVGYGLMVMELLA